MPSLPCVVPQIPDPRAAAEGVGFEPTRAFTLPVFETGALGLYATLPDALYGKRGAFPRGRLAGSVVGVGFDHAHDVGFVHRDERDALRHLAAAHQRVG